MSEPKLFLHDHPASSYAQKVRIALREKGIPFDKEIPPNLGSGQQISGLAEANPRMEVPALIDGDFKIFDSKVIIQYLEDKYPEKPLLPKDPKARAEARMIEEVCDTQYEAINWGMGEVFWAERATGELAQKLRKQAEEQTLVIQDWLSSKLGDKPYFNGDTFGFADLCVSPYTARSHALGIGLAEGSALDNWRKRILENPSVKQTTEEMEAAIKQMEAVFKSTFGPGSGKRREYRDHRLEWMVKSGGIDVVNEGLKKNTIRFSWPGGI